MANIHHLTIESDGFKLDGSPFRFIAGAIHYFRVPQEYWRDRLLKLRACGFNTVETYIAWNVHQPQRDTFDYSGMQDVAAFLKIAQEIGLYAIVRPGPYICSEWDFGGLPWWLLQDDDIQLRCMNQRYLQAVDAFFDDLMPRLVPLLSVNGGPILMMQVENEYGSYGDDQVYIRYLADGLVRRGVRVPLFTSDGPSDFMLTGGTLPDIHKTGNFGSNAAGQFAKLRERQPDGPLMCTEFWNGWFDHWNEKHHSRDYQDAAKTLDEILAAGASVSAYMFHGGTNFGWMNGANDLGVYQPTVNSYDDDAPVNECGGLTPKYNAFRAVIAKYAALPECSEPAAVPRKNYGRLAFTESADLLDNLDNLAEPAAMTMPLPMEKLGQGYGFILYRAQIRGPRELLPVRFQALRDRAHIFADGVFQGIQYRNDAEDAVELAIPSNGLQMDILVENMGRANYGYYLADRKGAVGGIRLGQVFVYHWLAYPLPLDDLSGLQFKPGLQPFNGRPQFLRATLHLDEKPCDTFVKLPGFKKGVIFINGRVLSRYWSIGPQRSAYLPAPFLREGDNELIVLELDGRTEETVLLDDQMDLG
ncbi:MAG: beta-galactosidase family protein [Clostridiaceae bacterium]|nr:beta-galactosidase family protein [Clostridiaceae bacterium]